MKPCIIQIPRPSDTNIWMSYRQLVGSIIVMLLLLIPFVRLRLSMRKRNS